MTKRKTPQTIEECNAELERTQKKIRQYENRSKMLDRRLSIEKRKERNHRLCSRGGFIKGQASIFDACPFVFSYIIPKCFGAVAFAFCFSDRHQGYLSFSDFSEVYSSLHDAVFLLRL